MNKPEVGQKIVVVLNPPYGRPKRVYKGSNEPIYPYSPMRSYKNLFDEYKPYPWIVTKVGRMYFHAIDINKKDDIYEKPTQFYIENWRQAGETYGRRHTAFESMSDYEEKMDQMELQTLFVDAIAFLHNRNYHSTLENPTNEDMKTVIKIVNRITGIE